MIFLISEHLAYSCLVGVLAMVQPIGFSLIFREMFYCLMFIFMYMWFYYSVSCVPVVVVLFIFCVFGWFSVLVPTMSVTSLLECVDYHLCSLSVFWVA